MVCVRSLVPNEKKSACLAISAAHNAARGNSIDHYGGEEGVRQVSQELPMQRMGTPDDIAKACLFLADPHNDYISGACLEVHGGGEPPSFLKIAEQARKTE